MTYIQNILLVLILILNLVCITAYATEKEDIRVRAGLDLFPSFLAADMAIDDKKGPDGSLLLVLLYTNDKARARNMAKYLAKVDRIHGIPIRIEISDTRSLAKLDQKGPAGLFFTQPLTSNLDAIIEFGQKYGIIVFSPFEGDVERGVLGGIHISERLLPYVNVAALQASKITIKPFFLRVSIRYKKE